MAVYGTEAAASNQPPTGADGRVRGLQNNTYRFSESDFPFSDPDSGDALESVTITSLPGGNVRLYLHGNQLHDRAGLPPNAERIASVPRTIARSEIRYLRYHPPSLAAGRPYTHFQFKVSDGRANSTQTYTMRIDIDPLPVETGTPVVDRWRTQIDGNALELYYRMPSGNNATMWSGGTSGAPTPVSAYDVTVDEVRVDVERIAFNYTSQVRLFLKQPVLYGSRVRVSYTRPDSNPVHFLRDPERVVASFSNLPVRNITDPPDSVSLPADELTGRPDDPHGRGVWGARLTVGSSSNRLGYGSGSYGSLTSTSFRVDGVSHTVRNVSINSSFGLSFLFNGALSVARRNTLQLRIGSRSFDLADAAVSVTDTGPQSSSLTWQNSGLNWSTSDKVSVYLIDRNRPPQFGSGYQHVRCEVDEHVPEGTAVCTYPARDPEGAGPVTYRLGGRDARFYRAGSWGTVYTAVPADELDYEGGRNRAVSMICVEAAIRDGRIGCARYEIRRYRSDRVTLIVTDQLGRSASRRLDVRVADIAERTPMLQVEAVPVTLELRDFPLGHDGSTNVAFELVFSEAPVDATPERIEALVSATNATVHAARRVEDGNDLRWTVELAPSAADASIAVSIPWTEDCGAANAICSEAGGMLENAFLRDIPYAAPIAATFEGLPETHDGTTPVSFEVVFDPEPGYLTAEMVQANLTVTDGTVRAVSRVAESNARWTVTIAPTPGNALGIALGATTDCAAANAICSGFGGRLETVPTAASIPHQAGIGDLREEPPAEPVAAAFEGLPEIHDGGTAVSFEIAFAPEPAGLTPDIVKANLTATGGSVGAVSRVTEGSDARWRVAVTPTAGSDLVVTLNATADCADANAICTTGGGTLEDSTSSGTIAYVAPLTVAYAEGYEPPAEHDGRTAFRFRIGFSEDLGSGFKAKKLRSAFEILQFSERVGR